MGIGMVKVAEKEIESEALRNFILQLLLVRKGWVELSEIEAEVKSNFQLTARDEEIKWGMGNRTRWQNRLD